MSLLTLLLMSLLGSGSGSIDVAGPLARAPEQDESLECPLATCSYDECVFDWCDGGPVLWSQESEAVAGQSVECDFCYCVTEAVP